MGMRDIIMIWRNTKRQVSYINMNEQNNDDKGICITADNLPENGDFKEIGAPSDHLLEIYDEAKKVQSQVYKSDRAGRYCYSGHGDQSYVLLYA
jgi:hypothetical protein